MSQPPSVHPVQVTPLVESRFGLDGGAMFGIIPRPLWSKTNPPDERNRIAMTSRCALITMSDGQRALLDVGMGADWSDKDRDIYHIHDQDPGLRGQLAAHGLRPEDIDHVILTHLHFDHAGGLSELDERGQRRAVFGRATHWVQRRNWSWAHSPSARDGGSYRLDDFAFLGQQADAPPLTLLDGVAHPLPDVEVLPLHGHTFGMQAVKIKTPQETYLFPADLIPTSSHLRSPYVMGYDLQPLITVQEKQALVYEAARHGWILIYEHDPVTPMSRVELDAKGQPRAVPL